MLSHRNWTALAAGAVALVVLMPAVAPAQQRLQHPRLHAALFELREARREIHDCKEGFGGHKEKALRAVDDAIESLKLVLRVKGDNIRGIDRDPDFYKNFARYPHCRAALNDLREAREEVAKGGADFRDHRERALRDIDRAIDQMKWLMADKRR